MERSESIVNYSKALLAFQAKMEKLAKEATNPFFKSKYCPLPTILEAIQKPLSEAGLCYSHIPDGNSNLTLMLVHAESGEYVQSTFDMHILKNDPQAWGSAMTYAKRYSLVAMLGLNIDDDDDGNAASQSQDKQKNNKKANQPGISEELFNQWADAINAVSTIDELTAMYTKQAKDIEAMPAVKSLFTKRKEQLTSKK